MLEATPALFETLQLRHETRYSIPARACLYHKAAHIIDAYLQRRADLASWQRILLHFHAGQMYAYVEDPKSAVERLTAALDSEDVMLNWNPYVKATIAFLERDMRRLEQARDELVAGPKDPEGNVPNLEVVQRFITHFDSSYVRAYEGVQKEQSNFP